MITQTDIRIEKAESDEAIYRTFEVMRQLRPNLAAGDYVSTIQRMRNSDGYQLAALLEANEVRALAGYRVMEMLYCGRILYVDDLVTDERQRASGYGKVLMDWLKAEAKRQGCAELHLDSGVQREKAHRFYFRDGLSIIAYHFRVRI